MWKEYIYSVVHPPKCLLWVCANFITFATTILYGLLELDSGFHNHNGLTYLEKWASALLLIAAPTPANVIFTLYTKGVKTFCAFVFFTSQFARPFKISFLSQAAFESITFEVELSIEIFWRFFFEVSPVKDRMAMT